MGFLEVAIRVVAPPQCIGCGLEGDSLCADCAAAEILLYGERCWNCGAISAGGRTCPQCRRLKGPSCVFISSSYEGLSKELVSVYKFGHQRVAAKSLSRIMGGTFQEQTDGEQRLKRDYLVIPVASATGRTRERSFDHAKLLCMTIARDLGLEYSPLLRRQGQSRQVGTGRRDRLNRPQNDYYLRLPERVKGRNILLIDDVLTTGGTLIAATRLLKEAGARRVDALVFAKKL